MSFKSLISNTAAGILIGWLSALVFVFVGIGSSERFWSAYGTTLITTVGALLGALLAVAAVMAQIEAGNAIEEGRLRRRVIAVRALLPTTLSEWTQQIEATLRLLDGVRLTGDHTSTGGLSGAFRLTGDAAKIISDNIEAVDFCDGDRLANLLRHQQVIQARLQDFERERPRVHDETVNMLIANCLLLRALVSDCFDFARGAQEHIPEALTRTDFGRMARVLLRSRIIGTPLEAHLHDLEGRGHAELF
ncbi:MAG TPA: hypothetical protein PKY73_04425 [Hyphomonas sp.]|nr:hypothetical protein [Hyphomonas sp.]